MADLLPSPEPFVEAIRALSERHLLPAGLTSDEIKQMNQDIRLTSLTSANTFLGNVLGEYKVVLKGIIDPKKGDSQGAYARGRIQYLLEKIGYVAKDGKEGTIEDLSSNQRVSLVINTNAQQAQGAGQFIQGNAENIIDLWPAQELYRLEEKEKPREWHQRWEAAARECGDLSALASLKHGRMVALKSSPIWQALGNGAGGYDDVLGNPFPPFAFNSGMWVQDVSRPDAVALGLIGPHELAKPNPLDLASLFKIAA